MDNVYVYVVPFPGHDGRVKEFVVPCSDGYTVYIDDRLSQEQREAAYWHALRHIQREDFTRDDVQQIETVAHETLSASVREPTPDPRLVRKRKRRRQRIKRELRKIEARIQRIDDYNAYAMREHDRRLWDF